MIFGFYRPSTAAVDKSKDTQHRSNFHSRDRQNFDPLFLFDPGLTNPTGTQL